MGRSVKLSDLFKIGSSKRVLKSQWQKTGIPFYRGREITKLSEHGFVENELFITHELYSELSGKHGVPGEGDIVITAIGTIGNSYIVRENDKFYFKDASVLWLKRTSDVSSEYVNWWLKSPSMKEQLDTGNGATVDTLTIKKLQSLVIELPSPEEQKRIVTILDQAFAEIEQARALAEKNLNNARELFESYLQQVFSQRGEGWVEGKLQTFCEKITVGHVGSMASKYKDEGVIFLRSQNIKPFHISLKGVKFIDGEFNNELKKSQLAPGNVAIVRTGYPGTAAVIPDSLPVSNCSDLVIVKTKSSLSPHFLTLFLNSSFGKALVGANLVGAAQKHFNVTAAKNVTFSAPSIDEQEKLASNADSFRAEIKRMEGIYLQKLSALDELKKSILQQAFSGQLTSKEVA